MVSEFLHFAIKHRRLPIYFKAKIDVIKMLPLILKKRRANLKGMKVEGKDLRKIMTPVLERNFLRKELRKSIFG
jgi:hypothetical protein